MNVKVIAEAVQNKLFANGFEEADIDTSESSESIWMRIAHMNPTSNDGEEECRVYITSSAIMVAGVPLADDPNADTDSSTQFQDEEAFMQYFNKIIDAATAYYGR